MFDQLYKPFSLEVGKKASVSERKRENLNDSSLTYGEVLFDPFASILETVRDEYGGFGGSLRQEEKREEDKEDKEEEEEDPEILDGRQMKFVDIGTGTGRPVFIAGLTQPSLTHLLGIEILDGLAQICREVKQRWDQEVKVSLDEQRRNLDVQFLQGDAREFFEEHWADADVVFMNATCFSQTLFRELTSLCEGLPPGSFVITTTQSMSSSQFDMLEQVFVSLCVFV